MELLEKEHYKKLVEPLRLVTFNNLFARSVMEQKVTGKIYVDNKDQPSTYYVIHPYGMSLLFGDCHNEAFNIRFRDYALNLSKQRSTHEWMQAFPGEWDTVLLRLFNGFMIKAADNTAKQEKGIIEVNTRINFKFNLNKYRALRKSVNDKDITIVRTDRQMFRGMRGTVVPLYFWDSEDDFLKNGAGFSLFYQGKLASTAYSSYLHDDKFEIGIETREEFRGKGLAQYTCMALIDYCIEHHNEPVWACRLENISSYKLALKLGFEPETEIPYYRLSN